MNILEFYKQNVTKNEYYYKFYDELVIEPEREKRSLNEFWGVNTDDETNDDLKYIFYDEEELIEKFKYLCEPNTEISKENTRLFHLILYYLNKSGYVLKEFPHLLERPPLAPYEFTYKQIRMRAVSQGKTKPNGDVPYSARRQIIMAFTFSKEKSTMVGDDLNILFENISTRRAKFENMAIDEKLKEIANVIEYMLKEDKKYISLDYNLITTGIINEQMIIDYRHKIQCFRHSSEKSLEERNNFTNNQKEFLIYYGVTICRMIYYNK